MSSSAVAAVMFACAFGGAVLGMILSRFIPPDHLRQESKEVIKLGAGLIATMAALVLGLLVATAASDFQAQATSLQQTATNIVLLATSHPTSDGPIAWVSAYPRARVVYIQLGHGSEAHRDPGYRALVRNAVRWVAGRDKG